MKLTREELLGKMKGFFMKSNAAPDPAATPEPAPTPAADPAPADAPATEIPDEVIDELMKLLESGEVKAEEQAIKEFCTSKSLSEDQCAQIWGIVSDALKDVEDNPETPAADPAATPDPAPVPAAEIQKSNSNEVTLPPDMIEFQKSMAQYKEDSETALQTVAALVDENAKLNKSITGLTGDVEFLKSEILKLGGQAVNVKEPVKTIDEVVKPTTIFQKSNAEITSALGEGARAKELGLNDVQLFQSKGILSDRAKKYLDSKSSQGGNV